MTIELASTCHRSGGDSTSKRRDYVAGTPRTYLRNWGEPEHMVSGDLSTDPGAAAGETMRRPCEPGTDPRS